MTAGESHAREWIAGARRVFAMTGAGISAESGIPTFRDAAGLWKDFRPEELASPEGFERDPARVWEWYAWRLELLNKAQPNAGHRALAELERRCEEFLLLTQNVDGLHQRAGSRCVHEVHGSIRRVREVASGKVYKEGEIAIAPPYPVRTAEGRLVRPDVVWFGEMICEGAAEAAEEFLDEAPPDVCLVVGTSGLFPYIQRWALRARDRGARLIEVNMEASPISAFADALLIGKAGEVLPRLVG